MPETRSSATAARLLRVSVAASVAALACLAAVPVASAHLILWNGAWSFRPFDKNDDSNAQAHCNNGTGSVDPITVVVYQYGAAGRADQHIQSETDYYDRISSSDHVACGTNDGSNYSVQRNYASDRGSGPFTGPKKHYRIWAGTHDHSSNTDRFSFLTPHKDGFYDHSPSEDWEVMKDDLSTQMAPEHIRYADEYYRYSWGNWRGKFWNGYMDRVGGLHNGSY